MHCSRLLLGVRTMNCNSQWHYSAAFIVDEIRPSGVVAGTKTHMHAAAVLQIDVNPSVKCLFRLNFPDLV